MPACASKQDVLELATLRYMDLIWKPSETEFWIFYIYVYVYLGTFLKNLWTDLNLLRNQQFVEKMLNFVTFYFFFEKNWIDTEEKMLPIDKILF